MTKFFMKAGLKGKYWIFYSAVAAGTVKLEPKYLFYLTGSNYVKEPV